MNPSDKACALVTGGSRGIGAAVAKALAAEGWAVGITFSADERAHDVADQVRLAGGRAMAIQADVRDAQSAEMVFDQLEDSFGPVLVLVNNAGVREDGLALQMADSEWRDIMEVNLEGSFRFARRALKSMLRARQGRIVNVASIAGLRASPGQANYAASKAGLIAMTKSIAAEVTRRGVTVNAVAPGLIDTELTADVDRTIVKSIPARRTGTADEVAACVRFLVSNGASYVTGATLVVDGGLSA